MKSIFSIDFEVEHDCHADHVPTDVLIEALLDRLTGYVTEDDFDRPDWPRKPCIDCSEPGDHTLCCDLCPECFEAHLDDCQKCLEWYDAGAAAMEGS